MDTDVDQSENILSDHGLATYHHGAPVFPCLCELCWCVIFEDFDDLMWHGYGNCVEIPAWMWEEM